MYRSVNEIQLFRLYMICQWYRLNVKNCLVIYFYFMKSTEGATADMNNTHLLGKVISFLSSVRTFRTTVPLNFKGYIFI